MKMYSETQFLGQFGTVLGQFAAAHFRRNVSKKPDLGQLGQLGQFFRYFRIRAHVINTFLLTVPTVPTVPKREFDFKRGL